MNDSFQCITDDQYAQFDVYRSLFILNAAYHWEELNEFMIGRKVGLDHVPIPPQV